jgi:precorrin-4 methylase
MGGKPVLYDPLLSLPHYYSKMNPGVPMDEVKRRVEKLRADNITLIKDALKAGKTVAFLEYGDPTIYGSWTYWLYEHFSRDEVRVVPGVSSFNAANAMIGTNVARSGSVIITVPDGIKNNEAMVQAAAKHGDTLAIFIALNEVNNLLPVLRKYYSDGTPVFVVYKAGYSNEGQLIRSTMKEFPGVIEREKEKFLGLIYIGADLK